MDQTEWIDRCAARLHRQWLSVAQEDPEAVARELYNQARWRAWAPEVAARAWLSQGIPSAA